MGPRFIVGCVGLYFLLAYDNTHAQNCRAVSECSSGKCVATVRCDNNETSAPQFSANSGNQNRSAPPLTSLTELAAEHLPENGSLKTQAPPPAGYSSELDETQTRWCIYESIRLQIIRGNQKYSLVREKIAEHRTACGAAKINTRVESIITSELLTVRPILQRQGAFYLKILSTD